MIFSVAKKEAGIRLANLLKVKIGKGVSVRDIKRALENNLCLVNEKVERFASFRVAAGDRILFRYGKLRKEDKIGLESERVLFEDSSILIYDKPAKISSDKITFGHLPVNRLDRGTTGVIILAKSPAIREKMVLLYRRKSVKKEYLAIVDGLPDRSFGCITKNIDKRILPSGKEIHGISKKGGRFARTYWKCLVRGRQAALMGLIPVTGRTHQLRLHMKYLGHPILGDYDYARIFSCGYSGDRLLLHSLKVTFIHPETGKVITIKAPLPGDFREAKRKLVR